MRVLLAMSGGVDSAVSAFFLKNDGHDVDAVFFRSWQNETELWKKCPWRDDLESAKSVATHLGINFSVVSFINEYREKVVDYFIHSYKVGLTPNPDVMCNRYIKFGALIDYAIDRGYDAVATGHYCKKIGDCLFEAEDKSKDQSYFLCMVRRQFLKNVLFPLGAVNKQYVRAVAKELNLPNAERKDSQGICFLGGKKTNVVDFLQKYINDDIGEIITTTGKIIGRHSGLHKFTIGQRKGINLPSNSDFNHYVVIEKKYETNQLIVGFENENLDRLNCSSATLEQLNFLSCCAPEPGEIILAKPRYRDSSQEIRFDWCSSTSAKITFSKPQRALALGQVAALYRGDALIGGGVYTQIDR